MIDSLLIVGLQVFVLFLLIMLGFFAGKIKLFSDEGIKSMNNMMLYLVTPCVIINVFQRPFDSSMLKNLLLSMLASFISHLLGYLLGLIFIRNKDAMKQKVLRFAAVFSNCGFMALPLVEALLGDEGVFYASGYLAVFNLMVWTNGQYIMARESGDYKPIKALLNPGVLGVIVGLILFFTSFELPLIISLPISYLSELNTPVPMLIIGYTISTMNLRELFKIKEEAATIIIKLAASPLLLLGILYLLGFRGVLLISSIVSASTPTAAITAMFSIKYGGDEKMAAKIVSATSVFSIITMTVIVAFAQFIA